MSETQKTEGGPHRDVEASEYRQRQAEQRRVRAEAGERAADAGRQRAEEALEAAADASERAHVRAQQADQSRDWAAAGLAAEERARRAAEEVVARMETLASWVVHDLRGPLAAVSSGLDDLRKGRHLERHPDLLRSLIAGAERIKVIIDGVRDFARLRLGDGLVVRQARADLQVIVARVLDELAPLVPSGRIQYRASGDLSGYWDERLLGRLATHLIHNALMHGSPSSPIQVQLSDEGGRVVLEVHNQGPLVPAALMPVIFEPFRQATSSGDGLGLGLYISDAIARAHGGTIGVSSSEAGGTTVTVRLPRGKAPTTPGAEDSVPGFRSQ
jgi:signal transduction histidine kinase